jgi:tetratricopeptide (TPR) repeat protein
MINSFKSEAQLAAVLGHEIAHIDLKHCVENLQYQLMLQRIIGEDLSKVANVAYSLLRLGYSELQEREADSTGLIFAANTGYSPLAGIENSISLMARFKANSPDAKKPKGPEGEVNRAIWKALKDHFQTHPPWDNRARELIALLNQNTTSWEGKTFYAGKSNLIDRKPLSEERRETEQFVFSHDIPVFLTERGELAMGVGDFHGAVGFFSRALALNPRSIRALSLRVKAFEAQSDLEAAIVDLEVILSIKREALSKLAQRVEQAKQKQNPPSLEKHLTNLLDEYTQTKEILVRLDAAANALKPKNTKDFNIQIDEITGAVLDARLTRADIRLEIGDLSGSLTDLAFVIPRQPMNFDAVKARALVRIAQGKRQVALKELAESIRLRQSDPEFYRVRAEIFSELGMAKRSERELGRYERLKRANVPPLDESKWDKLEDLWVYKKDRKAFAIDTDPESEIWQTTWDRSTAREAGLSALELCGERTKASCALYSLGTEVVWGKSVEELESEYDRYDDQIRGEIKREINHFTQNIEKGMSNFLLARGKAYRKLREHREAIKDFTDHLSNNTSAEALYLRGRSYHALHQYNEAIADFTKITRDAYFYARAFRRRGFAHLYNGDRILAERDFEKFISLLSSDQAWGYLGRGTTRLFQDKYDLAIGDFNRALSKKPNSSAYNNQICWSLAMRALPAAALPYCNKAIKVGPAKPAYRDSRAFVYWQLHRKDALDADIKRAKWVDPSVPYAKNTEEGYANLIVEIFLTRNGYDVGPPNRNFDEKTKLGIEAYQNARGLPVTGLITDDLIGRLSPWDLAQSAGLGFLRSTTIFPRQQTKSNQDARKQSTARSHG